MMAVYNIEPSTVVICTICNKSCAIKGFPSHLSTHNITFKAYIEQNLLDFPDWKLCPICNINITNKKTCSRTCGYKLRSMTPYHVNYWGIIDEETANNIKRRIAEKASIRQAGINPWARMSAETKILAKQKMSAKAKIQCAGSGNPMYGKTHTPSAIQKIFDKRPLNNLEKYVSDFLNTNNIDHYYNFFITGNSTHSYDFKIKGIKLLIEIDGDYWHGGPKYVKHCPNVDSVKATDILKTKVAEDAGFTLIRFWESDIEKNADYVFNKIVSTISYMRTNIGQ